MPEPHPRAEFGQLGLDRGRARLHRDPEPPGRPPHQRHVAGRIRRGQLQQPPGLGRQGLRAAAGSSPRSARIAVRAPGSPNPPASCAGVSPRGSSSSASGLPRVSATIWSRTRASSGPASTESSSARASPSGSPSTVSSGNPASSVAGIAGREDQADRIGRQPARHEPQRLRRGAVQPLLVIHQADQRLLPGRLRQQAEHGQAHQEPVRRRSRAEAERGPQRLPLRLGQAIQPVQHRRAQLMQAGEGQLHLRLDAQRAHHPAARRLPGQVVQQRGLAHARLAADHQHPALTGPDGLDEPAERASARWSGPAAVHGGPVARVPLNQWAPQRCHPSWWFGKDHHPGPHRPRG